MNRETTSQDWCGYLRALPDAEPPDALWGRIAQTRATATVAPPRIHLTRWRAGFALAASMALVATLVMRSPVVMPVDPVATTHVAPTATKREALRALDDAIALAYARNADEDELQALWQTRERLLSDPADSEPLLARL